jgi:hypothetical protein
MPADALKKSPGMAFSELAGRGMSAAALAFLQVGMV